MGIESSLRIKVRKFESEIISEYEITEYANDIEGLFHNYGDSLYICGQDFKLSAFISLEDANKFHFKVIKEDGESFHGETDFFKAKDFLSYIQQVKQACVIKLVDSTVEQTLDITRWQLTKDTHPQKVKQLLDAKFMDLNDIIKLHSIVELAANLDLEMQFICYSS